MTTQNKLSKLAFPSMVVVLTSLTTSFTFSPELEESVFNVASIPYCPPHTPRDREFLAEMKVFCYDRIYEAINTHYSIILLNNTPLVLEVLNELRNKSDPPNASDWLITSFFHDNEFLVTNKTKVTDTEFLNPQILLDDKMKDINRLSEYPYIKKIIIPYGCQVTSENIKTLFTKDSCF